MLIEKRHLVEEVYVANPDYVPILQNVAENVPILEVSPQVMHPMSQMTTPPGVLAVCRLPEEEMLPEVLAGLKIFYLDSIRDPGNLGTILRIADWFGLDFVLLSPDCVDIFNHKVLQSAMGSAMRVKTAVLEKSSLLTLTDRNLYVCDADGKSMDSIEPPAGGILVLGNEALGVSGEIMHQVTETISIPGHHRRGAESLNVASAAAILAYWWRKA